MRDLRKLITLSLLILVIASSLMSCTIGVFSGDATPDGRPILWKNRDVSNCDQEFGFFDDGRYSYVTNIYTNDIGRAWMGVNDVGFGIINSDTYNNGTQRYHGPDDGTVMKYALKNCQTIEDFEEYLSTTNATGRKGCHNYGVIDAFGGAAIFEAANTSYARFDASDNPNGYLIRANFAFSGDTLGYRAGYERFLMATEIASRHDLISHRLIIDSLASNLRRPGFDPLPLPFEDSSSPYPRGYIPTTTTINRDKTTSTAVIIGKRIGDDEIHYPYMWAMFGQPIIALPIPLWPAANGVPECLDGPTGSDICRIAEDLRSSIYDHHIDYYFNTVNAAGIQEFMQIERNTFFDAVETRLRDFEADESLNAEIIAEFQDSLIDVAEATYDMGTILFISEPISFIKPDEITVSAYPNPFNSRISIQLDPPVNNVYAAIYDVNGRIIANLCEPGYETIDRLSFESDELSSGVYFIRINVAGYREISKKIFYIK